MEITLGQLPRQWNLRHFLIEEKQVPYGNETVFVRTRSVFQTSTHSPVLKRWLGLNDRNMARIACLHDKS